MPIVRTFMCEDCGHRVELTLPANMWDAEPPMCPACTRAQMDQEFKPVAIGGSVRARAEAITEDIIEKDYKVGDIQRDRHEGATPKVRYADQGRPANPSTWGIAREALETAVATGRQVRKQHGSGLDILQANLKSGAEPDLIELSKRRAMRIY